MREHEFHKVEFYFTTKTQHQSFICDGCGETAGRHYYICKDCGLALCEFCKCRKEKRRLDNGY